MNYRPRFVPAVGGTISRSSDIDSSGVVRQTIEAPEITEAQARSFVSGNNSLVARGALGNTVQPSTAQLAGLLAYLAAIQAGTDTSSVETAIGLL
jgi:hypothetical protein